MQRIFYALNANYYICTYSCFVRYILYDIKFGIQNDNYTYYKGGYEVTDFIFYQF